MYKCECVHTLPFACQMNSGQLCSDVTLSSPSPPEKEGAQPARLGVQKGKPLSSSPRQSPEPTSPLADLGADLGQAGREQPWSNSSHCQPRPAQSPLATPVQPWLLSSRLLWCSEGRESACNAGDLGSISGWERCPGGGRDNPLPCPENPVD